MGAQGDRQRGELREILERPDDRGVCDRHLAREGVVCSMGETRGGQGRRSEPMEPATLSPLAGKAAPKSILVDVARLEQAYYERKPDTGDPVQLVSFGTSGHRGTPFNGSFSDAHIAAITQAICEYRRAHAIDGPLYMGKDTHALSEPAQHTALEVLAANGVDTIIQRDGERTVRSPPIGHGEHLQDLRGELQGRTASRGPCERGARAGQQGDRYPAMSVPPFPADYRASGVLMHVTSLPSPYGIGDVGPTATAWIDRLHDAGQGWWQALPLGPTGYADSPYQSLS